MLLLLIRHADAGKHSPNRYPDDTLRPLTDHGREVHARVGKFLRKRKLETDLILSSPWTRAWETAEITAEALSPSLPPRPAPELAERPELSRISRAIGSQPPDAVIALVGHEPWLSELASLLLTGDRDQAAIDFPKSGALGLRLDAIRSGTATLEFFYPPRAG
ncbi:MAG: histidine phosphatase family protein [Gemmatimonadota bacterium]